MTIEIRQVTIKSFVTGNGEEKSPAHSRQDAERMKEEILSECRELIHEFLRAHRER
jgi:hypothetical protein